ncbi:MAG: hypothetical protein D3916_06585 [Candidatus Electrothrix sp. MAN1_4]|nr:hypothetical protein [Candidatus Electrothrix sp. MAN1_4]
MHNPKIENKKKFVVNSWKMYARPVFGAGLFFSMLAVVSVSLTTAQEAAKADDTAAKALVEKKCTVCHSLDRIYEADKTHTAWEQTVKKMIRYSDQMNFLNQNEKETIIDFLAQRKIPQVDTE